MHWDSFESISDWLLLEKKYVVLFLDTIFFGLTTLKLFIKKQWFIASKSRWWQKNFMTPDNLWSSTNFRHLLIDFISWQYQQTSLKFHMFLLKERTNFNSRKPSLLWKSSTIVWKLFVVFSESYKSQESNLKRKEITT